MRQKTQANRKQARSWLATLSLLCLTVLPVAAAAEPVREPSLGTAEAGEDLEAFRAEMLHFVDDLAKLPPTLVGAFAERPMDLAAGRNEIAAMDHEQLRNMKQALDMLPYWRSMPSILATAMPNEAFFSPLELAGRLDVTETLYGRPSAQRELERLLAYFEEIGQSSAGKRLEPGFADRVASLRSRIATLDPSQRATLRQLLNTRAPVWSRELRSAQSKLASYGTGRAPAKACSANTSNCNNQSFPNDILCEIENIIAEIANIPCEVAQFASDAATFIVDQLEALAELILDLIPNEQDIEDLLFDLVSVSRSPEGWLAELFPARQAQIRAAAQGTKAIDEVFAIPCPVQFGDAAGDFPSNPLNIPLIGQFGQIDAKIRCDRRLRFVPGAIKDLVPDDTESVGTEIVFAVIVYVLDYLCRCYDAAYAVRFDDDQEIHRKFVARSFCRDGVSDTDCETWSLVDGCTGLSSCPENANADTQFDSRFISMSELARAGDNSDDCASELDDSTLNCVSDTVATIDTQVANLDSDVDDLNLDLADLDSDVAGVEAQVQASLAQSGSTSATLSAFEELALQLRIEADLIRDGDQRVALFQLPATVCTDTDPAVCGQIELVAAILEDAIAQRESIGRDVGAARFYLDRGDLLYQEGSFKKAYSQYRAGYQELVLTRN